MESVSTFVQFPKMEEVREEWEILDDPGSFQLQDVFAVLVGLVFFVIPGFVALWQALTRPATKGFVCVTNLRILYYSQAEGWARKWRFVYSVNLEDVMGVDTVYRAGWLGNETLTIALLTAHHDNLTVTIGDEGGIMAQLPLIGPLVRRRTIGRDAFVVSSRLFTMVGRRGAPASQSRGSF